MTLRIEIVSENRTLVGDDSVHEFGQSGGTIGRSLESDWILPDPDKYVSSRHAVIDFKGGIYYLVDLSTNGVFVNDEREPIGKGNTRRLFDGDRLRMGDFELRCAIEHGESIVTPLDDDLAATGTDYSRQRVPEVSLMSNIQLLDEEELTGNDEFQSILFGEAKPPPGKSAGKTAARPSEKPAKKPRPKPAKARQRSKERRRPAANDDLFDSFLEGAGLGREELHPSVDPATVMQNAGEILKEFVDGIGKLLVSRANLKTAFRLDQTTVLPRHNNPLKLSEDPVNSLRQLLVGQAGEYLGPRDAVREVCRDLLFHQDAFLDAMAAAFVEFADRFDPDELATAFDGGKGSKSLFGFLARMRYWQMYCDLYPVMTEKGSGRFPSMFAEEFVKSYELQIAEYQRFGGSGNTTPSLKPLAKNADSEDQTVPELAKTRRMEHGPAAEHSGEPVAEPIEEEEFGDELVRTINEELTQALDATSQNALADDEPEKASG